MLKNLRDLPRETHQIPIVYTKLFLKGAFAGTVLGGFYFLGGPVGALETNKVLAAAGGRGFSGRLFRIFKNTMGRYAIMGGTIVCGYNAILQYLRHHAEANPRPMYYDHMMLQQVL